MLVPDCYLWKYTHTHTYIPESLLSDGVGRTGTFICIHSQLERLKTEGVVDIFQSIKSARIQRAGLVPEAVSGHHSLILRPHQLSIAWGEPRSEARVIILVCVCLLFVYILRSVPLH